MPGGARSARTGFGSVGRIGQACTGASSPSSRPGPTCASPLRCPDALVSSQSVMIPVSGSIAMCALNRPAGGARSCERAGHRGRPPRSPGPGRPSGRSATAHRCRQNLRPVRRPDRRSTPIMQSPQHLSGPTPAPADGPTVGAHRRPAHRSAGPALGVVPGDGRFPRIVVVMCVTMLRDDLPGAGDIAPGRRIAAISWITVSWVATASSKIVESKARRVLPFKAPVFGNDRLHRVEDPVRGRRGS